MKRLIIGIVVALVLMATAIPLAVVSAQSAGPLDHVVISPVTATIATGDTQQFTAVAKDAAGVTLDGVAFGWAVAAGGGTINTTGEFTAGSTAGTYTNTVQVTGVKDGIAKTAFATVTVSAPLPLDHVVISPSTATIATNGTQQFTAVGQDSTNATVANVSYAWAVAAGGGTISTTGLFTAGSVAGAYTNTVEVTAVKDGIEKTAFATVTVVVPAPLDHVVISPGTATILTGGTQQFTAVGQDASNVTLDGVAFGWTVAAGGGTIDTTGLFTAGDTAGTYTNTVQVTAVKDGIVKTAFATVTVTAPLPLDHVVISPATATIATGGTQQFTAVGQDASNATVNGVTFGWTVVAAGGTIDNTGLFTAGDTTGTFTNTVQVTAVKDGITKTALATVTLVAAPALDHVVISPSTATVATGGTQQFTAVGQDASNGTVNGVTFGWTVVAAGGTIDNTGLFTAGTVAGTYTNTVQVTATLNGVSKTALATVTITVAPTGGQSSVPPGWSHGKKTGWHGGSMPPGLAKKAGQGQ